MLVDGDQLGLGRWRPAAEKHLGRELRGIAASMNVN
jgi:hypothetical protein